MYPKQLLPITHVHLCSIYTDYKTDFSLMGYIWKFAQVFAVLKSQLCRLCLMKQEKLLLCTWVFSLLDDITLLHICTTQYYRSKAQPNRWNVEEKKKKPSLSPSPIFEL